MKIIFYISIIFILIPPNFCLSEEVGEPKQQAMKNKQLIFELQEKLSKIEEQIGKQNELIIQNGSFFENRTNKNVKLINQLDSKWNQVVEQQKATLENVSERISKNKKDIKTVAIVFDEPRQAIEKSFKMNRIGSILILLALLFEIPGAIFLGGSYLANKQPHVFSLLPTPDLVQAWSFGYEKVWDRLSFFGLLASFFLIIGFLMQVIGITFILSLPLWSSVWFIFIAIGICFAIVYFLLGQYPDQSRKEKIKVFYLNIKRLFPFTNNVKCDYCSKSINQNDCQIWWVKAPDPETRPYKMHLGHEKCLEKSGWYKHIANNEKIYKASPSDFLEHHLRKIEDWWTGRREYSTHEKGKKPGGSQYEHEFINTTQKVKKLVKN